MHSVKLTIAKFLSVLFVACGLQMSANAQENSPYSRYGLGDLTPNRNIFTRGMGGIAAGVSTNFYRNETQSLNFTNPASLANNVYHTIFDVGIEADFRTLKSTTPAKKFNSANSYFSYLQVGFPLSTPKMKKKNILWAMSFGLRPVTKINYKIEKNERLTNIDSLNTLYEGSGGVNQAFIGTGFRIKNFSLGINAGYMFGSKDYSTKLTFINDTSFYYLSNSETKTTFGGLFLNAGMHYEFILKKEQGKMPTVLRVGLYGNLQQNLRASRDIIRETIYYDPNGGYYRLDSVYEEKNVKGKIKFPATIGLGFVYQNANWMYGADFEYGNWGSYRYYGQTDAVKNSWTLRAGAEYFPAKENAPEKRFFRKSKYRAGLYYGSDYISVNKNRPEYGFTLGTGMPLTKGNNYIGGDVVLNTALEIGNRGNKQTNLRENIVRFSIGISMNAVWFRKPKYN